MPVSLTGIEATVALIAIIAFLVSVGKWIQMREAIAQRVIEVDEKLKGIEDWRTQHIKDSDAVFARKENCALHMLNFDEKFGHLEKILVELKKSLDKHIDDTTRRR